MIILLTHDRFDAIKTASHRPDNVNNNARGQCFGIGNMAAMATRWLQRHRPMRDPVCIQISGCAASCYRAIIGILWIIGFLMQGTVLNMFLM